MTTIHTVAGKVIKVSVGGATGNRIAHILQRGDIVPEGVDPEQIERLVKRGLIEKAAAGFPDGDPVENWKTDELKAYAEAKSIDVSAAKNKGDLLAAIQAAQA